MENVTALFGSRPTSLYDKGYDDAGFDVSTVPLMYFNEKDEWFSSSKVAVVRTDTMEELGVHGHKYKPVAPKTLIDAQRAIIMRSALNTEGITETIATSHNGSRTFVRYTLPNHNYTTPDGDTATLELLGTTSFDSSFPFILSVGARQAACLNGQVFVSGTAAIFKARHTMNLDIGHASRVIVKCLEVFDKERDLWRDMYNTPMTEKQAMYVFAEAANCLDLVRAAVNESGTSWSAVFDKLPRFNSTLTYLSKAWTDYSRKLGPNQWAVYNTLTDWSTHAPAATKKSEINIASVSSKRQDVVRRVVGSDVFRIAA
tara:strand:+ start:1086 stop:2030 length:945 start_codon:yes stop_codon:yes gene_type:complete